ncbi:MAG: TetR/AcrR family transcriptional regulator [Firmicutes bacterium]|nr:TetR/AcrR family transcriptional regulator [Bacillota bacterium]
MVKQGFRNLSVAEQERVLEAALDEFADKEYEAASLNRIIQNAGISKGSMYHYFQNKEDLYMYILSTVMEEKKQFLMHTLPTLVKPNHELGLFETISLQLEISITFARANPRYHMINTHLQNMPDSALKHKIWGHFEEEFDRMVYAMVEKAIECGELREDMDKKFIMRVLRFMLLKFTDFYPDYQELLKMSDEVMQGEMKLLMKFLKHGLRGPK